MAVESAPPLAATSTTAPAGHASSAFCTLRAIGERDAVRNA